MHLTVPNDIIEAEAVIHFSAAPSKTFIRARIIQLISCWNKFPMVIQILVKRNFVNKEKPKFLRRLENFCFAKSQFSKFDRQSSQVH